MKALIIVDVQNDFVYGSLAVPGAKFILDPINEYVDEALREGRPVFFSRCWHPANHCSFKENGGIWPAHCVANSAGAALAEGLRMAWEGYNLIDKGREANKDAYSAFDDTPLQELLRMREVDEVWVGGLATDYCVRATVLDALKLGFKTVLLEDIVRAVDIHPGDGTKAFLEMRNAGAKGYYLGRRNTPAW